MYLSIKIHREDTWVHGVCLEAVYLSIKDTRGLSGSGVSSESSRNLSEDTRKDTVKIHEKIHVKIHVKIHGRYTFEDTHFSIGLT